MATRLLFRYSASQNGLFGHMQILIIINFQTLLCLIKCFVVFQHLRRMLCIIGYVDELFPFELCRTQNYVFRSDVVAWEISVSCIIYLLLGCPRRLSWPCIVDFLWLSSFGIVKRQFWTTIKCQLLIELHWMMLYLCRPACTRVLRVNPYPRAYPYPRIEYRSGAYFMGRVGYWYGRHGYRHTRLYPYQSEVFGLQCRCYMC